MGADGAKASAPPARAAQTAGRGAQIAGLKVSESITVLLVDFSGTEIGQHDHDLKKARMSGEELADEIKTVVAAACAKAGVEKRKLGIAIGLPGQIDAPKGSVHWSSSLTERNVQFGEILSRKLSSPVFIDNDANLVAIAEQLFGDGQGYRDFLVVTIEHGVGMGIVLDGKLYRGARGCGADSATPRCRLAVRCANAGSVAALEAYVAITPCCARPTSSRWATGPAPWPMFWPPRARATGWRNGTGPGGRDVCHGPVEPDQYLRPAADRAVGHADLF